MVRLTLLFVFLACTSWGQTGNGTIGTKPSPPPGDPGAFELIVYSSNYSMAYALQYVLTNNQLKIVFQGGLEGEQDTTLLRIDLRGNEKVKELSDINIDSLKGSYSNDCIRDGSQISVKLTKGAKSKMVHLSNYYQEDIGLAIELINSLVPKVYKIWYDKERLLKDQQECDKGSK